MLLKGDKMKSILRGPVAHWCLHGMGWRDFQQRCSLICLHFKIHWPLCRADSTVDPGTNKEATSGVITVI